MVSDADKIAELERRVESLSELVLRQTFESLQAKAAALAEPPPAAEPPPPTAEDEFTQRMRKMADPSTFGNLQDFDAHLARKVGLTPPDAA